MICLFFNCNRRSTTWFRSWYIAFYLSCKCATFLCARTSTPRNALKRSIEICLFIGAEKHLWIIFSFNTPSLHSGYIERPIKQYKAINQRLKSARNCGIKPHHVTQNATIKHKRCTLLYNFQLKRNYWSIEKIYSVHSLVNYNICSSFGQLKGNFFCKFSFEILLPH